MRGTWKVGDKFVYLDIGSDWSPASLVAGSGVDRQALADLLNRERFMVDGPPAEPVKTWVVRRSDGWVSPFPMSLVDAKEYAAMRNTDHSEPVEFYNIEEVLVPAEPEPKPSHQHVSHPDSPVWAMSAPEPKPKYRVRCSVNGLLARGLRSPNLYESASDALHDWPNPCPCDGTHTVEEVPQ